MPSTVSELFAASEVSLQGVVPWGKSIPVTASGVYVISMAENPESGESLNLRAPLDREAIANWLERVPGLELDRQLRPQAEQILARLNSFWLPDENILYVGKATKLGKRVGQYYRTPLGKRSPHAGGHWIKTLSILSGLFVHYGESAEPLDSEFMMLGAFVRGVSGAAKNSLHDPNHPFPFANLEYPQGTRKVHGIGKATL